MENKNKKNPFSNMGTGWNKFDPLVFSNFLRNPPKFLEENIVKALMCDVMMVETLLGVDPIQRYGENTKALSRIS